MSRVVIMLGAPGAGKGTQALRISSAVGLPHISTGDLFRANISQGTELGEKAKSYLESGRLVPDELVIDMLFDRVGQEDCQSGYLLDGFPRTLAQAQALGDRLPDTTEVVVLDLAVDDSELLGRTTGRMLCKACGNIQHKQFSPPKEEGICDACGGGLYQRSDDRDDVVKERLAVYHEQTEPLVAFYQGIKIYKLVDGSLKPDQVFDACMASLEVEA